MTRKTLPSQDADLWPGQPQPCRAGLGCGARWVPSAGPRGTQFSVRMPSCQTLPPSPPGTLHLTAACGAQCRRGQEGIPRDVGTNAALSPFPETRAGEGRGERLGPGSYVVMERLLEHEGWAKSQKASPDCLPPGLFLVGVGPVGTVISVQAQPHLVQGQ